MGEAPHWKRPFRQAVRNQMLFVNVVAGYVLLFSFILTRGPIVTLFMYGIV